jgi:hypothetical protein
MDPRPPTAREKELVYLLLPRGAFPDVDIYRSQVEHLMVTDRCPCGCPTVSFSVDTSAAGRATFRGNPLLPVEAETGDGESLEQLILFARSGFLESLELVYYGDKPPSELPEPAKLRLLDRLHPSPQSMVMPGSASDRRSAWQRARKQGHAFRRRYLACSAASYLFAVLCVIALISPVGVDEATRRAIGTAWWDLLASAVAFGWILLGTSYCLAALSDRPSPPWWWLPWTR